MTAAGGMGGRIEFKTQDITDIGTATTGHRTVWDQIWEDLKKKIGTTVSTALDQATGMSLEERSVQYYMRSAQFSGDVGAQAQAVHQISNIATETNQNMVRAIRG